MSDAKLIREAALLPVAALCLGLAYNSLSPLGVRFSGPAISIPVAGARAGVSPEPPVANPALQNETLTAAIVSGGPESAPAAAPHRLLPVMSWPEVKAMLARHEGVLVDGRESLAYEAGHIPGALSLLLKMVGEKIGGVLGKFPRTAPVVVYCASPQCGIAHAEALLLGEEYGYVSIREMPSGYAEWLTAEPGGAAATGNQP